MIDDAAAAAMDYRFFITAAEEVPACSHPAVADVRYVSIISDETLLPGDSRNAEVIHTLCSVNPKPSRQPLAIPTVGRHHYSSSALHPQTTRLSNAVQSEHFVQSKHMLEQLRARGPRRQQMRLAGSTHHARGAVTMFPRISSLFL